MAYVFGSAIRTHLRIMGSTLHEAFSGADNAIFRGLRERGHSVGTVSASLPRRVALLQLLRTISPSRRRWSQAWHHAMVKSPRAFVARSRVLDLALRASISSYDTVLHIGGLFAPFLGRYPKPVGLFCDYTTKLAEINYSPWYGLNGTEAKAWYSLETDLYRSCAVILSASENTKRSLVQHFGVGESRVTVVGEGVERIHRHPEKTYTENTIIFVGIDFVRKGGPTLLQAFDLVRRSNPDAKLLIVGPDRQVSSGGVTWVGPASRETLNTLFAGATVFTMPSVCEPFGLAIIEAMSHGLPVVGTTVDAMPEIVVDGETGFLVRPGDPASLAERLLLLLSDARVAREMGERGQARVEQRFLWGQVVDRVESALRSINH